ncbi:hypothetical protein [Gelatiniphilus marinus]|uniref:V-type ATP synthase subunit E n=1 Tax=Gelatiniphilus marinus TaxID=1759464 RepID=A0ABW5JTV7_9FLAO
MQNNTLDELIAKVKSEAIDNAEKESQRIINEAKQKAAQLLNHAQTEKQQLLNAAKKESEALLNKGEIALKQAARDVHITVKNDLLKLFKSVLEAEVKGTFTIELYTKVILQITKSIGNNLAITLPASIENQMVEAIRKKVAESNNSIKIIESEQLLSGLSVAKTNEGWSYDITAEEVAALLSQHLSKKWVAILNS